MKTILQVVQHLSPGGIETMVLDLAAFSPEDTQTYIVSLEGNLNHALEKWPRLQPYSDVLFFLNKKQGVDFSITYKLEEIIKHLNADIIHTHHIGPLLYGSLAALRTEIKTHIHTEHDAWHLNSLKHRMIERNIIKLSKPLLIADAETVKHTMKDQLLTDNIRVIYNGIDTEKFTPGHKISARLKMRLPCNVNLIGCSGRLEAVKGQDRLIKALKNLPNTMHLALAGDGSSEATLRALTRELNLNKRVHFLGKVDDMPNFYRALDSFCLPSHHEGFPLSPLEAQACGIRAAVTHVGGAYETLCPFGSKLITTQDPKSIAMALMHIDETPTEASPRTYIKDNFDVRQMVKAYHELHSHHGA